MNRETYRMKPGLPAPMYAHTGIHTAVRIAKCYRDHVPAPAQLMADFGMSRATAFRWVAALRAAA